MLNFNLDSADQDIAVYSCQSAQESHHWKNSEATFLHVQLLSTTGCPGPICLELPSCAFSKSHHWKNPSLEKLRSHFLTCSTFIYKSHRKICPGPSCQGAHFQIPLFLFSKSHPWKKSCQSAHFQSPIIGKTQKPLSYMFNFYLQPVVQDLSVQSCQAAHSQSPTIGKTQKPPPYMLNFNLDSADQDIAVYSRQSAHFQSPIIGKTQKPHSYMFNFYLQIQTRLTRTDSAGQDTSVQSYQAAHFQSPKIGKTQKPPPYLFTALLPSGAFSKSQPLEKLRSQGRIFKFTFWKNSEAMLNFPLTLESKR